MWTRQSYQVGSDQRCADCQQVSHEVTAESLSARQVTTHVALHRATFEVIIAESLAASGVYR